jgi:hypothetical protein
MIFSWPRAWAASDRARVDADAIAGEAVVSTLPRRLHHLRMGRPNFTANSWSRSSCAGTAMMAPVP